jgi:hypothetical protein
VWNQTFTSLQTTTGVGKYLCGGSHGFVAPLSIAPSSVLSGISRDRLGARGK